MLEPLPRSRVLEHLRLAKAEAPSSLRLAFLVGILVGVAEAAAVVSLFLLGLSLTAPDTVLPFQAQVPSPAVAGLLLLGTTLVRAALRWSGETAALLLHQRLHERWAARLYGGYLDMEYLAFSSQHTTSRFQAITNETERGSLGVVMLLRTLAESAAMVVVLVTVLATDWRAAAFGLVVGALALLSLRPVLRYQQEVGRRRLVASRRYWTWLTDTLSAYRLIYTYRAQRQVSKESSARAHAYTREARRAGQANALTNPLSEVVMAAAVAILLVAAVLLNQGRDEVLPLFLVLVAGGYRILPGLASAAAAFGTYRQTRESLDHVQAELRAVEAKHRPGDRPRLGCESDAHVLELRRVQFHYPGSDNVLDDVSLNIAQGEKVGIVGSAGAGKSTLVDLVLGLLEPVKGEVRVAKPAGPEAVAYLPQQGLFLDDTIHANVHLGQPAPDEAVTTALLRQVGLRDHAGRILPPDHRVGEGGSRLSGGQRQKLGLARALRARPALLVLDEPSASMDPDSERELVETLRGVQGAMLIISHRPGPLLVCDRILRLEGGQLRPLPRSDLPEQ